MTPSAREVRKTVTILFCDLVHSTGLAEGDLETYRRIQTRFFDRMREIVERHGGTVEKFIGDEVMAVFGVPVVHEDDALRAVRAAQEMQEALPELGLEARIGINTGEVLAGDPAQGLGFVAGEPVIIAKRLEQAAAPGEILIGKETYPLVRNAVGAGPLERLSVKGKEDDVGRHRVDEVDPEAPGVARRLHAPLVGRRDELELLRGAFERAVEERSCRLFTVLGPAGIGKSRLAAELISSLKTSATAATGRCLSYGEGITFGPLTELLRGLGGEEALRVALAGDEQLEIVLRALRSVTGASEAAASNEETFWAVRRAFEALARKRPLVLCFEDLHWAETTLLDLVEYVCGWSRNAPILVLVLARPELVELRPQWIGPRPDSDALALEPLAGDDIDALLAGLSAELPLTADDRRRIAAASEGNPLFLEQMGAMAAEQDGGGELSIPPSIQALLAERLDRLTPPERETIERASVAGRDFPLAAVAALSPQEERATLAQHLLALVRKGFVKPDPSAEEDRFRFQHVLVRDAAYQAIPKQVRADLHERIAGWAEKLELGRELDELVGYHLERTYRYREEIGPLDSHTEAIGHRAGELLGRAGRRAFARDDMPAAIKLFDRALALVTNEHPAYPALVHDLSFALFGVGEVARSEALLRGVLEAASAAGDRRLEWTALLEQAARRGYTDPDASEDELLETALEAIRVFEELGDDLGLARAWRRVASCHEVACRFRAAEEACERALVHARRAGSMQEQARTIDLLCTNLVFGPTPAEQAITRCETFLAERGSPLLEANVLVALAVVRAMVGDFDQGRRLYERGEAIYRDLGLRLPLAGVTCFGGLVELLADDPTAAERHLRRGYEVFMDAGISKVLPFQGGLLAEALRRQGRREEAAQLMRRSGDTRSNDVLGKILARIGRAHAEAYEGQPAEAVRLMRESVDLVNSTDALLFRGDAHLALAETLILAGQGDEAAVAAAEAARLYREKGSVVAAARADRFFAEHVPTV